MPPPERPSGNLRRPTAEMLKGNARSTFGVLDALPNVSQRFNRPADSAVAIAKLAIVNLLENTPAQCRHVIYCAFDLFAALDAKGVSRAASAFAVDELIRADVVIASNLALLDGAGNSLDSRGPWDDVLVTAELGELADWRSQMQPSPETSPESRSSANTLDSQMTSAVTRESAEHLKLSRLSVNIAGHRATLDGQSYDLTGEKQARWLQVLCDNPESWISGPKLKRYDPALEDSRTDRLRKNLPQAIADLIQVDKNFGARLRLT